jgi:hypothetical protein
MGHPKPAAHILHPVLLFSFISTKLEALKP